MSRVALVLVAVVSMAGGAAAYRFFVAPAKAPAFPEAPAPAATPEPTRAADPERVVEPAGPAPEPVAVPIPSAPSAPVLIGEVTEITQTGERPFLHIVGGGRADAGEDDPAARETARRIAELDERKQLWDQSAERARGTAGGPRGRSQLTMYSATWCGPCKRAKAWLAAEGIPYENRDIDEGNNKAALLALNPRGGVPTFDLGGKVLVGFAEKSLRAALSARQP